MVSSLLKTIAKFAEGPSAGLRLNDLVGSTAYALGAGDEANIPASQVFKHSILPFAASTLAGAAIGTGIGAVAPSVLEHLGVIAPADPVTPARELIHSHGGATAMPGEAPATPAAHAVTPTPSLAEKYLPSWSDMTAPSKGDHLLNQWWSDQIRDKSLLVGGALGTTMGQNYGRKEQFMHGVRDALESRISGHAPWTRSMPPGTAGVHIPWKARS